MDTDRDTTWSGRRVLVTGHTGFKGAWLSLWLQHLGAEVSGLSLRPTTEPNLHELVASSTSDAEIVDLRDRRAVATRVEAVRPEVVFHLAAQSLVRRSFAEPVETFAVNVVGTANLLEAARAVHDVRAVVVVTSDKVYEPSGDGEPHDESSRLGGVDPYSASKAATEHVVAAYRRVLEQAQDGPALVTARAGNVIGGGDWAPDRVVTDLVRALEVGEPVRLRYPEAVRPWQHVLDPLAGYLRYAEVLLDDPAGVPPALNFGPDAGANHTVAELVDALSGHFGGAPGWVADERPAAPETHVLRLSGELARRTLGWSPAIDFEHAIDLTARWYRAVTEGADARAETLAEIVAYPGPR